MHLSPADLHILLVEPSEVQRKIIRKKLAEEQVTQIEEADSLASALNSIQQHKPDAIACALHLADGTAEQLLTQLKSDSATAEIPFLLVSSETRKAQLEAFKQSGVVAILPKPFDAMQLGKALNAAVDLLSPAELELTLFDVHDVRVLVVDDSRLARNHIRRVLSNLGMQHIVEAEDGKQAFQQLQQQMFDLVVTDFNMPGMNGIEVMQEMLTINPALKTAIASGFVDEALTEAAREAGVSRLIFKESAVEDFCAVIRGLIEETR